MTPTGPHPSQWGQLCTVDLAEDPRFTQIEDLRVRLAEAEAVIAAIHEISVSYVDLDTGPVRGLLAGINGTAKHYLYGKRRP